MLFLLNGWSPIIITGLSIIIGFLMVIYIPFVIRMIDGPFVVAVVTCFIGLIIAITVPVAIHITYKETLTNIESKEKMAVSPLLKSGVAAVEDEGPGGFGMRVVSVLENNGDAGHFYYSPQTNKAIKMQ
ncbi:hypothetical protein [Alicyclobacillus fodiniaquatilis]|uniref:Uncharacterized protein n=1 Tax=Alicyclobacillus fodiniaquatilis TaxID=1661150 RepID=A0ABW4JMF5_9BACL